MKCNQKMSRQISRRVFRATSDFLQIYRRKKSVGQVAKGTQFLRASSFSVCPRIPVSGFYNIRNSPLSSRQALFLRPYSSASSKKEELEAVPLLESGWTPRSRFFTFGILPSALLVFVSACFLIKWNDERRAIPKATKRSIVNNNRPAIGGPFELIDCNNNIVASNDFFGNWTLIYFGYTSSPDVDPVELQKMATVINILEKRNLKINPVFITLDPTRDTPSHLQAYLKEFHEKIIGLTGPVDALRQVAQQYRVYFKRTEEEGTDYLIDSSHNMYLFDSKMEFVRIFGREYDAAKLADAIEKEAKVVT